jgi:hypothetical protein
VTTAQIVFSVALGFVTLLVVLFAVYVISSTAWGDRWSGHRGPGGSGGSDEP